MPVSHPAIAPVRVRGAGASHVGANREHNDDAFDLLDDRTCALAVVADGLGPQGKGGEGARRVVEICRTLFRGRGATILDDLAEVWWRGEHEGARVRPFSTLPIGEKVELRERVRRLLELRLPETLGDAAVLEAETQLLLGIGARALERVNADLHRLVEKDRARWHGVGACAACATFASGTAAIAHVGDCRVYRLRSGELEALTRDHTILNDGSPEERGRVPGHLLTRVLGARDRIEVTTVTVPLEPGDVFLLATDGLWSTFSETELLVTLRSRGAGAADYLVERGRREREGHLGDNLTAAVVEIVGPDP